jgi:cyclohexanone monooxygenase
MREHGKKRIDVVKEAETRWSQLVKGIAGYTLLPKAESWQFGCNVPGAVREPLLFSRGRGNVFGDFGGR